MPCMVIIIGYGGRRKLALTQDEVAQKSSFGQVLGGCPNCTGSGLVSFQNGQAVEAILNAPTTTEKYVLSFAGSSPEDAEFNAKAWISAEHDWLNPAGKLTHTFQY